MLFNEIGEIVHGTVDRYSGNANKNIGDHSCFWKIPKEDHILDEVTKAYSCRVCSRVNQLADMSLISFLLLVSALKKSRKMIKYNTHKG